MKRFNETGHARKDERAIDSGKSGATGITFNLPKDKSVGIIKVVGVGGGGCNAVSNMWQDGIENVTFAACNTDSQQLQYCPVPVKLQLGTEGLGVGGNPDIGRKDAEESVDQIRALLNDGTKMVFVTASMGGGTGTGAAPVVARVAREMGLLTIGIVTIPFALEQRKKILKALRGVEEMRRNVDALLIVNNENLLALDQQADFSWEEAFKEADNIVKDAAKSISELITTYSPGCINVDFRDVETTLRNGGWAIMAAGRASGENRLAKAFVDALSSPLLYGNDIVRAKRILIDVYTSSEAPMRIRETQQIYDFMKTLDADIDMIFGTSKDETLGQDAKIIILAAGEKEDKPQHTPEQETKDEAYYTNLMEQLYKKDNGRGTETAQQATDYPHGEEGAQEPADQGTKAALGSLTDEGQEADAAEEQGDDMGSDEGKTTGQGQASVAAGSSAAEGEPLAGTKGSAVRTFLERAQQWLLSLTNEG